MNQDAQAKLNVVGVILSGGAGRRFNGHDKGLSFYRGKPLIAHVITAIEPQVMDLILCVNRNLDEYRQYGYALVTDQDASRQGPLAGITAAIDYLLHQYEKPVDAILVSSCDSPSLPDDYVNRLKAALSVSQVAVVYDGKRRQNLHCLITKPAWASLSDFYVSGGRAMHRWFEQVEIEQVDLSDCRSGFSNINSPEQLNESL